VQREAASIFDIVQQGHVHDSAPTGWRSSSPASKHLLPEEALTLKAATLCVVAAAAAAQRAAAKVAETAKAAEAVRGAGGRRGGGAAGGSGPTTAAAALRGGDGGAHAAQRGVCVTVQKGRQRPITWKLGVEERRVKCKACGRAFEAHETRLRTFQTVGGGAVADQSHHLRCITDGQVRMMPTDGGLRRAVEEGVQRARRECEEAAAAASAAARDRRGLGRFFRPQGGQAE